MADYDFFDLTHLPFDPPETVAQKVIDAIEKAKKELDMLLNSASQQLERDEITGKRSFLDSMSKRIFNNGELTPDYNKLAEDKVKKEIEKLRAVVLLLKQSGSQVITDGAIRGQQKKTMLSGKNVEDIFLATGFTVRSTADLFEKYPRFPTNADKMYAELEAFRNSKDPKPNANGAVLKQVQNLYDLAAYFAGEPERAAEYNGKSTSELKSLFDGFSREYATRTDNFGHLCSSLATAGKTYVFDSEDHRQGYEAYRKYKTPSLTRLFSQMKSFSMHQLLEPKFAEACIKEISAVFGDYEVSLAIYNKEAGFKDEFYMPEREEEIPIPEPVPIYTAPVVPVSESRELWRELYTLTASVRSVAWSPDGRRIVSGSWQAKTIKIWDAESGQELRTLKGHTNDVESVAWSPGGRRIVSGSADTTIKIWDAESGQKLRTLKGHTNWVFSVAWSPDGRRIASGSSDETIKIWDAESGQKLRTLEGHTSWVWSIAWSPDGRRIVSGTADTIIKIWDVESGRELHTLKGHTTNVFSVAWSPDGRRIASGSADKTTKIWDAESGRELHTLKGHTTNVFSVAWSPDGRRIVSGLGDNTVRIWDAENGQKLYTLKGHTEYVRSVAWSPDGRRIVFGLGDNTVRIWGTE